MRFRIVASAAFCFAATNAYAQAITPQAETDYLVNRDSELMLGEGALGDELDKYTGTVRFRQVDISIPGNSELPVELARRFDSTRIDALSAPVLDFLTWGIDIPRITTVLANTHPWPSNRCSTYWTPPDVSSPDPDITFWNETYWQGYVVQMPSASGLLLDPAAGSFPRPSAFKAVMAGNVGFSCTNAKTPSGGAAGEGFIAHLPNGTRYFFDIYSTKPAQTIVVNTGDSVRTLQRHVAILTVSKVMDRYGNSVVYNYDTTGKLTSILGSDGRQISLTWTTHSSGASVVSKAAVGAQEWVYTYSANELGTVVRPDGSRWQFSMRPMFNANPGWLDEVGYCCLPATGTITSPYGLTGTFTIDNLQQNRGGSPFDENLVPTTYHLAKLTSKVLSGPAFPTRTWSYAHGTPGGWSNNPGRTDITDDTAKLWITDPSGAQTRYFLNFRHNWREGNLEKIEFFEPNATIPTRTVTNAYEEVPLIGKQWHGWRNVYRDAGASRLLSTTITENGDSYYLQHLAFDAYQNPTQTRRWNSFSTNDVTDFVSYSNSVTETAWVIGQIAATTTGSIEVARTTYNALAQPVDQYSFGLRTSTKTYNKNGLVATDKDGLNRTTTFTDYFRGTPRLVTTADNAAWRKTVNTNGTISSATDPLSAVTSFGYDLVDRLAYVIYPTGDTVVWLGRKINYVALTVPELGMPVGTWRARVTGGAYHKSVYFDAQVRPVLEEEMDTGTGITRYKRHEYDYEGRPTFESYWSASSVASAGIRTTYDVLGRAVLKETTDGIDIERNEYLPNNSRRVTDANGNSTTTSFQVLDEPDYSRPTWVEAPEGQTTTIARDVFGKITGVSQSGLYVGSALSATRSFQYDAYQRPCRRIDPESGSTVWGYDSASQIVWEAKGQTGSGCLASAPSGATVFTYDPRGRQTLVNHPGSADDVTLAYDPAGNLTSVSNPTAVWTYSYNKRNLLETEQAQIDGKTFLLNPTYNGLGQVSSLTTPARTIAYAPDAWGRASQLGTYATGVQYHPNGIPSSYALGNGLTYTQSLNARQWPSLQTTLNGSAIIQKYAYSYSNSGDLTFLDDQVDSSDDATLGYDNLHRLKTATGLWGSYTYAYDPLNNIKTRTGPGNLSYSYNASSNLLTGISGSQARTYSYNAKGEITGDGSKTFTLNSNGQITSITGIASYAYDGNGKRIKSTQADSAIEYALYSRDGALVYSNKIPAATSGTMKSQSSAVGDGAESEPQAAAASPAAPTEQPASSTSSDPQLPPVNVCAIPLPCPDLSPVNADLPAAPPDHIYAPPADVDGSFTVTWGTQVISGFCKPFLGQCRENRLAYVLEMATSSSFADATVIYDGPYNSHRLSLLPPGSYYFRIRSRVYACGGIGFGYDCDDPEQWYVTYTGYYPFGQNKTDVGYPSFASPPPATPANPAPGSTSAPGPTTASRAVFLSWSASDRATSYTLDVTDVRTGSQVVNYSGSSNYYSASLSDDTPYRWHVNACNSAGCSANTATRYFQTPPPSPPTAPANPTPGSTSAPGPTTGGATVSLSWSASDSATSYTVNITDVRTGSQVVNYSGSNTSYVASLGDDTPYRWFVKACNSAGCSGNTAVRYFQTPEVETQTDYLQLNGQTLVKLKLAGSTTTASYLHPDLLGSPRKATSATKAILWQEHFDPYGQKLNGAAEKIGYTGHAHDPESGYTYMQARFYDPLVGRFLSTDPVGFQDSSPFTFSRYSYANNNPYKYVDPDGRFGVVGFAIGAAIEIGVQVYAQDRSFSEIDVGDVAVAGIVSAVIPGLGNVAKVGLSSIKTIGKSGKAIANLSEQAAKTKSKADKLNERIGKNINKIEGALADVGKAAAVAAVHQGVKAVAKDATPPVTLPPPEPRPVKDVFLSPSQ